MFWEANSITEYTILHKQIHSIKEYTILYMYIAQGQGQITPGKQNFNCSWKVLLLWSYNVSFNHKSLIQFEKMIFQYFTHTNV